MLKRRLYEKLKDKLGELLFGFDEQQLDVGFFGGDIMLKDLIFRPKKINEIFEKQNLPFALKAGMIAKMDIKVRLHTQPNPLTSCFNGVDICVETLFGVHDRECRGCALHSWPEDIALVRERSK